MLAGRPRKYKTVEELQESVNQYFTGLEDSKDPPTITGLALALDFTSRQSIYDAANREDEFSYIIKKGCLMIENFWEKQLAKPNNSGSIFWLKNRGWSDRQEIDHTSGGEKISINLVRGGS